MSIIDLRRQKDEARHVFERVRAGIDKGLVKEQEAQALLMHKFGSTDLANTLERYDTEISRLERAYQNPHSTTILITGFAVIMVALFSILFFTTGGITGAAVLDISLAQGVHSNDTVLDIFLESTTKVQLTGSALGDVSVVLVHDGIEYVLFSQQKGIATEHASIDKTWYLESENVTWTATGVDSTWLHSTDNSTLLGNETSISGLAPGDYRLKLFIGNDTIEELGFTVAVAAEPATEFSTCGEACEVNLTGNATIEITVDGKLNITGLTLYSGENMPPEVLQIVPDMEIIDVGRIDLRQVFLDPDGDTLLYSSSQHPGVDAIIEGDIFTVSGEPGTYAFVLYASDLKEVVESNMFAITLRSNATPIIVVNETIIVEVPLVNDTIPVDTNITISNVTIACDNPNPNLRPIECLQMDELEYFPPQDIYWEDDSRIRVAMFNQLGNLLIRGTIIENSPGEPGGDEFRLATIDRDGRSTPVIWIDSATGDLHLKGRLYEEVVQMAPPPGSYSVITTRSIYLAYANLATGDLYVRGNLIPYRRAIT